MLSLIVNWAYTEVFTTSRFVGTASVAVQQPQVQAEIAKAMINPLIEEIGIPDLFRFVLQSTAERVVSSASFQTFWSDAIRTIHEPLVKELKSDTTTVATSHRVDLRPMVYQLVRDIRRENPRLGLLIADRIPEAEFELLNAQDLETARSAVSTMTLTRSLLPLAALVLLALSYLTVPRTERSIRRPARLIAMGSGSTVFVSLLLPSIAGGLAVDGRTELSKAIASTLAASLRTQSLIVMFLGLSVLGVVALSQRRQRITTP